MPSLDPNFAVLALQAGILQDESHFLFLQSGAGATLDLFISSAVGITPVFTLNTKAILDGTGHPSGSPYFYTGTSYSGDYFINRSNYKLYYNTGSAWNTGVSLIGSTGATGPAGATGPTGLQGTGVPSGGSVRNVLFKSTNNDYDTSWGNINDIIALSNNQFIFEEYTQRFQSNLFDSSGSPSTDVGSGITFWPRRGTILVVVDGSGSTPALYEYSIDGKFIRSIALNGFYDIEAIDFVSYQNHEYDQFIISEERASVSGSTSWIHTIKLSDSTTSITNGGSGYITGVEFTSLTKNSPNQGIEAISYNPIDGRTYFILQAIVGASPNWYIYYINDFYDNVPKIFTDINGIRLSEVRDMCIDHKTNTMILAGYYGGITDSTIVKIALSDGEWIEEGVTLSSSIQQLEGVCISDDGNGLFLTGEDASNGADIIGLFRNDLTNPIVDNNGYLKYFGGNGTNSVHSKIYSGINSSNFIQTDSAKSILPSLYFGYKTLPSGFSSYGNSLVVKANGTTIITSSDSTSCELKLGLENKIGATIVGGISVGDSIIFNSGKSNWIYESKINFRKNSYTACTELEVYPETATGSYSKRIYLTSGTLPAVGDYSLYATTSSGGVASYNYNIELYQLDIFKD